MKGYAESEEGSNAPLSEQDVRAGRGDPWSEKSSRTRALVFYRVTFKCSVQVFLA